MGKKIMAWVKRFRIGPVGICPGCTGFAFTIRQRGRNTAFANLESNYLTVCANCQRDDDAYYEERWTEYYGGLL